LAIQGYFISSGSGGPLNVKITFFVCFKLKLSLSPAFFC